MKVKVIKSFIDKETKQVRKLDEVFECTEKRFEEISKAGKLVEPVAEPKEKQK